MTIALSLRKRVALWFAGLGMFLCTLFAAVSFVIAEGYEHLLIGELLDDVAATRFDATAQSRYFQVYAASEAPEAYRALPPGIHEWIDGDRSGVHVGVYEQGGQRVVIVTELGEIEVIERYLALTLLLIVIGGGVLAGALGWVFSSNAIRPVRTLADEVGALPTTPVPMRLHSARDDDVLAPIVTAIDRYVQRLVDTDAAEKRFYADASHELRTPITVIQGATEVLRDDPQTSDAQKRRLARIERAVTDLGVMLDAMLLAARAVPEPDDEVGLDELLDAALGRIVTAFPDAAHRITRGIRSTAEARVPRRWAEALLDVLLLRTVTSSPAGDWEVGVVNGGIRLRPMFGVHGGLSEQDARADLGFSLRFAERLAASFGWSVMPCRDAQGPWIDAAPRPAKGPSAEST